MVTSERWGLEQSGSRECLDLCEETVAAMLRYAPNMVSLAEQVYHGHRDVPMANVIRGYMNLMTTEAGCLNGGRAELHAYRERVGDDRMLPRERAHMGVLEALAREDLIGAAHGLRGLSRRWPRDPLALFAGHALDFFTGDALALRDRIGEALPSWSDDDPDLGPILGMHAFGLEEAGDYGRAEQSGLRALSLDARDPWAIHAVAHTYEMQARFGEGVRFLEDNSSAWSEPNYMRVHNWWHYGLYLLEIDDIDRVRTIYDEHVFIEPARTVAIKMCDASAMLWRLHLEGVEEPLRWRELSDVWANLNLGRCYSFNDMHAVMAYVGAGDMERADGLIADRTAFVDHPCAGVSNYSMTARIGLPVCRAIVAFSRGRYNEVVDLLMPIRYNLCEFGGSHAQRDAVLRTLLEAAIRGGRSDVASGLLRERIALKPGSPYNWVKRCLVAEQQGDLEVADAARDRARQLVAMSGLA